MLLSYLPVFDLLLYDFRDGFLHLFLDHILLRDFLVGLDGFGRAGKTPNLSAWRLLLLLQSLALDLFQLFDVLAHLKLPFSYFAVPDLVLLSPLHLQWLDLSELLPNSFHPFFPAHLLLPGLV